MIFQREFSKTVLLVLDKKFFKETKGVTCGEDNLLFLFFMK